MVTLTEENVPITKVQVKIVSTVGAAEVRLMVNQNAQHIFAKLVSSGGTMRGTETVQITDYMVRNKAILVLMPSDPFSIVMKVRFNEVIANAIVDSGAGVSVMDLGTFESLQLGKVLQNSSDTLHDTSGTKMDIIGIAKINVNIIGGNKTFCHDFRILHNR